MPGMFSLINVYAGEFAESSVGQEMEPHTEPDPFEAWPRTGTSSHSHHCLTSRYDFFYQVMGSCYLKMEVIMKVNLWMERSWEKAAGSGSRQVSCGVGGGHADSFLLNYLWCKAVPSFWMQKVPPSVK